MHGQLEKEWHARYERWAKAYNAEHLVAGWSEEGLNRRLALVLRSVAAVLKPASNILDLGAGPGTYTRSLKSLGHKCLGLDYSRNVIEVAKAKDPHGIYVQGEAYHLPFGTGAFDAVVCVGVLQSLQSIEEVLCEIHRVLRPGGCLFLDGLNGVFWLHAFRSWRERLRGSEKRMVYYNPVRVVGQIEEKGFQKVGVHWLAMPEQLQERLRAQTLSRFALLPMFFGYAFLIVARKDLQ
jgi:ubiquinone/menaquinone biosynthesis C-methylase UbiE